MYCCPPQPPAQIKGKFRIPRDIFSGSVPPEEELPRAVLLNNMLAVSETLAGRWLDGPEALQGKFDELVMPLLRQFPNPTTRNLACSWAMRHMPEFGKWLPAKEGPCARIISMFTAAAIEEKKTQQTTQEVTMNDA